MAQPPSYEASNNSGYQAGAYPPPPQGGAYPPPPQGGAYPPPQGGAYPPPQQGAYPPPQQGSYAALPPEPYHYPNKQADQHSVEYQGGVKDDNGTMGIINFDDKSIRLSK